MFEIRKRITGRIAVLTLSGELDEMGVKDLKMYLSNLVDEGEVTKILFKMSRVTTLRYSVLPLIDKVIRAMVQAMDIGFSGLSPALTKTFQKANFVSLVKIYDNEEDAIKDMT